MALEGVFGVEEGQGFGMDLVAGGEDGWVEERVMAVDGRVG